MSSPSVSEASPSPSPSSARASGSSRASRPARPSPVDSSRSVTPQSVTAHGRSAGDQPVSSTSSTPPRSTSASSGKRTPVSSSGSVPSEPKANGSTRDLHRAVEARAGRRAEPFERVHVGVLDAQHGVVPTEQHRPAVLPLDLHVGERLLHHLLLVAVGHAVRRHRGPPRS